MKKMNIIIFCILLVFVLLIFFPNIITIANENTGTDTEYWGLLVAVGVYADDPQQNRPLMFTELDGLYDLLIDSPWWNEDHIKVIRGEDATVNNILNGLKWLDEKEDSNDISLFYITTHGFPLGYDIPPLDEADGTDEALMSFWGFAYPTNIIWDDEINIMLNRLESYGVCMIVDSCYAGGFNDPPDWNQDEGINASNLNNDIVQKQKNWIDGFIEDVKGQGRVVIMASRENEVSYSGGFSPYLIDGLRGYADTNNDEIITAEEAFYYTEPRTSRQLPTIYDGFEGELPLITTNNNLNSYYTENKYHEKDNIKNIIEEPEIIEESTVCGYIKDEQTAQPIENALVTLLIGSNWDGIRYDTITDSEGFFNFSVESGDMRIFAEAKGYFNARSDYFNVGDQVTFWVNVSMSPHPQENATICGYIKDLADDNPLEDVEVTVDWGHQQNRYWNNTYSDINGFYTINIAPGDIDLEFESTNYLPYNTNDYTISEYEILWINVSMIPRPVENSLLCGYVKDSSNDEPIDNAHIYLELHHLEGYRINNETSTDENGFFSMNIPSGETYLYVYANDYYEVDTPRNDIVEDGVLWINVSLDKDITALDIEKPLNAIYVNNERIIPNSKCIIIGSIDITAYMHDFWYRDRNDIEKVEFYIDDNLKYTAISEPYTWTWADLAFGSHIIKIIAYDDKGNSITNTREVTKIM